MPASLLPYGEVGGRCSINIHSGDYACSNNRLHVRMQRLKACIRKPYYFVKLLAAAELHPLPRRFGDEAGGPGSHRVLHQCDRRRE